MVVSSADELKGNQEFQVALALCWPSIRVQLDDELRNRSGGDALAAGMYLKAHFDVIAVVERLVADSHQTPAMRVAPPLRNKHFKDS